MLTQPTIDKLNAMRLHAMARAFLEQTANPEMAQLAFEERFGLIVDQQMTELENRRMKNRLKSAKLRLSACIEDIDFRKDRGLDRSLVMSLSGNQWVRRRFNILITGPSAPARAISPARSRRRPAGTATARCTSGSRACFRTSRWPGTMAVTRS